MPRSVFDPPTFLEDFFSAPLKTTIRSIYPFILFLRGSAYRSPPRRPRIRVVCISDTHNHQPQDLPEGDLLIHAGDLTNDGTVAEIQAQIDWLKSLSYPEKVVIAGNHDSFFDPASRRPEDHDQELDWGKIHYLEHSAVTLTFPDQGYRELYVYGAPEIPRCGPSSFAFQYSREQDMWTNTIPLETEVLVTHAPPKYHLDLPVALGCIFLLKEIWRVRPILHVFGHVHAGHGRETAHWDETQELYERIVSRQEYGPLMEICNTAVWWDVLMLLQYGLQGILLIRMGSGTNTGTELVNAALSYRSTGRLGNPPQVVDI